MIPFDIGDPANPNAPYTPGTPITLPGSTARLIAINDTPYQLLLTFSGLSGTPYKVPSGWARIFTLEANQQQVTWVVDRSLAPTTAIISDFTIECYMPGEPLPDMHPILRQISGSTSTTVIANELGTNADGITVVLPDQGIASGQIALVPYSTRQNATRDVALAALNAGVVTYVLNYLNASGRVSVLTDFEADGGLYFVGMQAPSGSIFTLYDHVSTAGEGLPPIRAALEPPTTVAVTTQQTVLTFTPAANGLYMAMMRFRMNNGTSPQAITAAVSYTDPDANNTPSDPFAFVSGSSGAYLVADGVTNFANGVYIGQPVFVRAKASTAISLIYRDPAGTPADQVSGAIVQIA